MTNKMIFIPLVAALFLTGCAEMPQNVCVKYSDLHMSFNGTDRFVDSGQVDISFAPCAANAQPVLSGNPQEVLDQLMTPVTGQEETVVIG